MFESPEIKFEKTKQKLDSDEWLVKHEHAIKELFPHTFTHLQNIDDIKMKHRLGLYGIEFYDRGQYQEILDKLVEKRIILRHGMTVKRNPHDCVYD